MCIYIYIYIYIYISINTYLSISMTSMRIEFALGNMMGSNVSLMFLHY